jgi:hypothetical protein
VTNSQAEDEVEEQIAEQGALRTGELYPAHHMNGKAFAI